LIRIGFLLWLILTTLIYWLNISSITSDSFVQKMGMVAGSTLLAILPLMSVKWWCYLEEQTNGRRWPLINHLLAPVVAIITPLIFIGGAEYIHPEIVLLSLATSAVFLPSGQLRWFWQQRFGDLKSFPDSGQVSRSQLSRIRNQALGWIFMPLPLYFFASLLWQR
jgi:hypothetical protein